MADIRIKDLATTASTTASDDFLAVDGTTNGTRKLSAATPSFATSVTVPGVAGPTATDLTLTGGSTGASLVLGQGASAASSTITNTGTGSLSVVNGDYFNVLTLSRNSLATNTGTTMVFRSKDAGGTYVDVGAFFAAKSVATIGAVDSFLTWSTRRAGTLTDAMTLASTGNLLIGTTTDINRLTVAQDAGGSDVTAGNGQMMIAGSTNTNKRLAIGYNTTSDYGWMQAALLGTAYKPIAINPNGGNLLIGGTTDITGSGGLKVFGTTAASSTASGALQVAGGVGVVGAGYFGDNLIVNAPAGLAASFTNTTDNNWSAKIIKSGGNELQLSGNITANSGPSIRAVTSGGAGYAPLTVDGSTFTAKISGVSALSISAASAATFAGAVTVGGNITLPAASAATTRYIISASNNDGTVVFQNGVGSAVAGGSLQLSGLTHATRPGWVTVGLGSGSTRKFTVSDIGVPGGTDVFTVDQLGKTTISDSTASTGVGTGALQVAGGIYAGAASVFGSTVTALSSSIIGGTGGNARLGSVAGRVDLDPTNGRVALYGASAVDRYLDIIRADGTTIGVQLLSNGTSTFLGGATFGGAVAVAGATVSTSTGIITPAATTAISSVRLPHGTAPTSPVNGDMWTTTAGLYVRINGVTVGPLS